MNTNLTEKLTVLVDYATDLAKTGADFTKEQAPLVVNEFLTWSFFHSCFMAGFYLGICLIAWFILYRFFGKAVNNSKHTDGFSLPAWCFILMFTVFPVLGCVSNILESVKIKVAPRIYMIEWVSDQIKGQ